MKNYAKKINFIFKESEKQPKKKRKKFLELGLKLVYLDESIEKMEKNAIENYMKKK
jgi:hypothetical protein|tara:strand:- start:483 stop:650 length:168 start_codon:yes stop_codon:yes gene_type:complete